MDCKVTLPLLAAVLSTLPGFAQEQYTIYPGQGIGTIRLGNPQDVVNGQIGTRPPSEIRRVTVEGTNGRQGSVDVWLSYQPMGLTFVYDETSRKLRRIIVTTRIYFVKAGSAILKVGDRQDQIPASWENREAGVRGKQNEALDKITFPKAGIEFWVDTADKIFAIVVGSPPLQP